MSGDPLLKAKLKAAQPPSVQTGHAVHRVNRALRAAGHAERLAYNRGKDYYYFHSGGASEWFSSSVPVSRASGEGMSTDDWLSEHAQLASRSGRH